jgi:YggT family protein
MHLLAQLLDLLCGFLILDAILSWIIRSPQAFPRNYTAKVTEPLYRPIRKLIDPQRTGGLDLSPLAWILGLQVIANLLRGM